MARSQKKIVHDVQNGPKILIFDIETAPILGFFWGLFKQYINIDQIEANSYVLCWSAKWLGKDEVYSDALPEHSRTYKKDKENDKEVLKSLWLLLNEADYIVAHNGNYFDIPVMNTRFLYHGMTPPSPSKQVDTCMLAKRLFRFSSNKLDYIARFLGLGQKTKHNGFALWKGCMDRDPKSWKKMVEYNIQDVVLLEKVYTKLAPWSKSHPNYGLYVDDNTPRCVICGSPNLRKEGFAYTNLGKFQQYQCKEKECGKWQRGRTCVLNKEKKKGLHTNVM